MGFVTFELDLDSGATKNVQKLRTFRARRPDDDAIWQVTLDERCVSVAGRHDGVHRDLGTGVWSGKGVRERHGLVRPGYPDDRQWGLVERALRSVGERSASFPVRILVASALGVAMAGWLLYCLIARWTQLDAFPLHGWHRIVAPIAGVLASVMMPRGIAVLASPAALEEPMGRDSDGKRTAGPIASRAIAAIVVGLPLYAYAWVMIADGTVGRSSVRSTPPVASAPATGPTNQPTKRPVAATPPVTPPERIEVAILKASSVTAAIELVRTTLGDGADNPGAWLLARYASARLAWTDVHLDEPETTLPLVLEDSERERGKRLCTSGVILEIERTDLDRRPVYTGALQTKDGDRLQFIAVGSSGELVKRSTASICGIVTGRAGKAGMVVGMFELPENQRPIVER